MRTLYQPAALEEFRDAIIWCSQVAGQQQAEANAATLKQLHGSQFARQQ